jgi:poly(A) polymerase
MMNARELAEHVCRTLREAGHPAYFVGGCVRDILLGREPVDYDVATDATPDRVQQIFPRSLAVGARFGVMIVADDSNAGDATQVEVATFRSDIGYSDGRHPDRVVYATSPQEDVKRRDFTINALLLDPETEEVLDFVGGRDDLRAGIIRAIGRAEDRFREDKLRMVRAVRLSRRLPSPPSLSSLRKSIRSLRNAFAMNSPNCSRKVPRAVVSNSSMKRGFSTSCSRKFRV